jgi:PBP1b-binding outer membrane lipoprotein LpoB
MKKLTLITLACTAFILGGCASQHPAGPSANNHPVAHQDGGKLGKLGKLGN